MVLGGGFAGGRHLQFAALEHIIGLHGQPAAQKLRNIKVILFAGIQQVLVLRMLGNIEFVGEKRSDTLHLQDALAAIHHRKLVRRHQIFATMSSDEFKNGQKITPLRRGEGLYAIMI